MISEYTSLPKSYGSVIWMIPEPGSAKIIQAEINRLSDQFGTQAFQPHITTCRIPETVSLSEAEQKLDQITAQHFPFEVRFSELKTSAHPFQKLTLSLAYSENCNSLLNKLNKFFNDNRKFADLHLSLLYGYLSGSKFESKISETRKRLPDSITIPALAIVKLNGEPENWEILSEKKLSKS